MRDKMGSSQEISIESALEMIKAAEDIWSSIKILDENEEQILIRLAETSADDFKDKDGVIKWR